MYRSVEVDVDVWDILNEMSDSETTELVRELLMDGCVPSGWSRTGGIDLSDGAVLLDVIVELRRMGYTVEPGGE